jgi:predicted nucleotidyltransferase
VSIGKKHILQIIRQYVSSLDNTAEVFLYGSRARADEKQNSDWGLLILTNLEVSIELERKFRNKLYDLELEIEEPISVFIFAKNNWQTQYRITPFYENVIREGVYL